MGEYLDTIPRRLGDFEIVREIGRGGMGVVYEARQVSLNRRVALKVLSGGCGVSERAVVRFRREAEAAARLHHTNIVPIYAIGEEAGLCYYAMELVEGPSLNRIIGDLRDVSRMRRQGSHDRLDGASDSTPHARKDAAEDLATTASTGRSSALPSWVLESMGGGEGEAGDREEHAATGGHAAGREPSTASGLIRGSQFFDTIARLLADVADALNYAHSQGVIHRDIKPANLLLSCAGTAPDHCAVVAGRPGRDGGRQCLAKLSINDFGLARLLEQPGMTMTGEFMGTPMYMSPEQMAAGRAPLDHRTDIYSLGATLYELLTLQPPFAGQRRDEIIAQIITKEPASPRRINKKIPVDLETICLKAMEKDPDRRYQTAREMAADLLAYANRFAISAKRAGPAARVVKWCRRRPAVAALAAVVIVLAAGGGLLAYRARTVMVRISEIQRQKAIDDALLGALSGNFQVAETAIAEAELHGAGTGWVRMLRGQLALQKGLTQEAVEHLEQAVRLLPDSVAAQAMLTYVTASDGQIERYYAMLKQLEQSSPRTAEDCLFKGYALADFDPALALVALDEAIRQRDSSFARVVRAHARCVQAEWSGDVGDVERALEDATVAKSMLPGNSVAIRVHLLANQIAVGAFEEAGLEMRRAAALSGAEEDATAIKQYVGSYPALCTLARYLDYTGREDLALDEWRRAVANGVGGQCERCCSQILYRRGAFKEALEVLDAAPERAKDVLLLTERAYNLAEYPGRREEILAICRDLTGRRLLEYHALLPQTILGLLGRKSEAMATARQMQQRFSQQPAWIVAWYKSLVDYQCGLLSAEELFERAGSHHGRRCEAHFYVGLYLLADGDRSGAAEQFRQSVRTRVFDYFEYTWSRNFLARIEKDQVWPEWLPADKGRPVPPLPNSISPRQACPWVFAGLIGRSKINNWPIKDQ